MSTRALITVKSRGETFHIYRHCDGYPQGESGVIRDLKASCKLAWPLPRFEASDFAAAIVATMKTREGQIYLSKSLDCGQAYTYVLTQGKGLQIMLAIYEGTAKSGVMIYQGTLPECLLDAAGTDAMQQDGPKWRTLDSTGRAHERIRADTDA